MHTQRGAMSKRKPQKKRKKRKILQKADMKRY